MTKNSELRAEAGILYVLSQLEDDGHVYYPYEPLVEKCQEVLEVERNIIINAFGTITVDNRIVIEDLNESIDEFKENNKTTVIVTMDNDWTLSFRIHNASSRVEASLKFDINLLKSPKKLFKNTLNISRD